MAFDVPATAYDAFMGRWSGPLADLLLDRLDLPAGARALDVGCGPGALTERLARLLGADHVTAVDPMAGFVAAVAERVPGVDVRQATAEALPLEDGAVDAAIACLVVNFMSDRVGGLTEMRRVSRRGGLVAATVWDHGGGRGPLSPFWDAVRVVDPGSTAAPASERSGSGSGAGELADLLGRAGLTDVADGELVVTRDFATFEEWWEPFTFGVGPIGDYLAGLHQRGVLAVRDAARDRLGAAPFTLRSVAWYAVGRS